MAALPEDLSRRCGKEAVPPPFLGTPEHRQLLNALTRELLDKGIVWRNPSFGEIKRVNIEYIVPEFHFYRRLDILSLLSRNPITYYVSGCRTRYFKAAGSLIAGFRRIHKYRTLFRSIRRHGLIWDVGESSSLPWLFASKECIYRLDGHHRASIARFLGHKSAPVLMMTPKDFGGDLAIDPALRKAITRLHEPVIDLEKDTKITSPSQAGAS